MQIHEKENILARTGQKVEKLEGHSIGAALRQLSVSPDSYRLEFEISRRVTHTERSHFTERVQVERRFSREGGRMRYFVSWLAFAFEAEGAGSYALYLLGGIPMTLGINIPVALGDWLSLPFRLRGETAERAGHEDKITKKIQEPVPDCSLYAARILKADYPLAKDCSLVFEARVFAGLALRENYKPNFAGMFRYELVDRQRGMILMNSTILIKSLSQTGEPGFIERP